MSTLIMKNSEFRYRYSPYLAQNNAIEVKALTTVYTVCTLQ